MAELMTHDESASTVLALAFSGVIGPVEGKGVGYSLIDASGSIFSWSVALENIDGPPVPIDRYMVKVDRHTKAVISTEPIVLTEAQLAEAILSATGQTMASAARFTDGALSISYKVTTHEDPNTAYVVQMRHHANVASMNSLINYISKTIDPNILPVARAYPIPGEHELQTATGFGRQITEYVPGIMASSIYPSLPFDKKMALVKKMALAFQACWDLSLPGPIKIGELVATNSDDGVVLRVEPDRHYSLGGPFTSVRDYLQAYIKQAYISFEKQQGIDDYKDQYLEAIGTFVNNSLGNIPSTVEGVPIVMVHSDMGPHNIILSSDDAVDIKAIIDWEFVASAPFASLFSILEKFFRMPASNGNGQPYNGAEELRRGFWNTIPKWKRFYESEATQIFLEWFKFGLYMKPEWRPKDMPREEAREYWCHNVEAVERVLQRYS